LNSSIGDDIYYTSKEILKYGIPRARNNYTLFTRQSRLWFSWQQELKWMHNFRGMSYFFPALLQHCSAKRVRLLFGNSFFESSFKVTNVRNPWDALVSFYHWEKSGQQGRYSKRNIAWNDFLFDALEVKKGSNLSKAQEFLFYPYLFESGQLVLNGFIYFEDLGASFDLLSRKLGINIDTFDNKQSHFKKSKNRKDYRFYFTDVQAELVRNHFNEFLKILPYTFDSVGTLPK